MNDRMSLSPAGNGHGKSDDAKVPPSDYQSEQAVLGAILLDPTAFAKAVDYVKRESFYWEKHGVVFEVMHDLFRENEPTDVVTVRSRLEAINKLEIVGGTLYLTELSETVPFPRNVDYYAKLVQEKYLLRQVSDVTEDVGTRVFDPAAKPDTLLDWALGEFFQLQRHSERSGYRPIEPVTHDALEDMHRIAERKGALTGIGSGYSRLDEMTGGFQRSDLIILAARPSMGKTALALCFGYNAARQHKEPVGIISLEMSAKQIAMRLLAIEAKVPLYKIRTAGKMSDEEWQRVAAASGRLSQLPIYIDDSPSQTITDVRARARLLQVQHKVGVIVLDYLQLMQPPARAESQQQAIAQISRQLKGLAKELDVPVIALSQLSRAVETRGGSKRPILSDLRDSGAIEQDADVVMFVYRQAYYDRLEGKQQDGDPVDNTAEIIIAKQRNGPTGTVELAFLADTTAFAEINPYADESTVPEDFGQADSAPF